MPSGENIPPMPRIVISTPPLRHSRESGNPGGVGPGKHAAAPPPPPLVSRFRGNDGVGAPSHFPANAMREFVGYFHGNDRDVRQHGFTRVVRTSSILTFTRERRTTTLEPFQSRLSQVQVKVVVVLAARLYLNDGAAGPAPGQVVGVYELVSRGRLGVSRHRTMPRHARTSCRGGRRSSARRRRRSRRWGGTKRSLRRRCSARR